MTKRSTKRKGQGKSPKPPQLIPAVTPPGEPATPVRVGPEPERRELAQEFATTEASTAWTTQQWAPMAILSEGMQATLRSQERENDLNRLIATIQPLTQATDVSLAMNFLYSTQCEAKAGDAELRFKAATNRCSVPRFNKILRDAPITVKGWDAACISVLTSIDRHYLAQAKAALYKEMKQQPAEDPALYADRIMYRTDVYKHFAELGKKTVDDEELTRKWILGLSVDSVRQSTSVAMHAMAEYSIEDALAVARVAHTACGHLAGVTTPLQSFEVPSAPAIDVGYLQQCMSQMEARITDMVTKGSTDMAERMALMQASGMPTKFPCVMPACNGAMHRWADCPHRTNCRHCSTPGHHSEACYKQHPHLDHRRQKEPYRPKPAFNRGRERSPPRRRPADRDRSPDRRRPEDRERDRPRDRDMQPTARAAAGETDGKRLNEKGSR